MTSLRVLCASLLIAATLTARADLASAGTTWKVLASPNLVGQGSDGLAGVACPGTANCFAVGTLGQADGTTGLIMHWDGSSWSRQLEAIPFQASTVRFKAVSCPSTTTCIAVGTYNDYAAASHTLVEQLEDGEWNQIESPNPVGTKAVELDAVRCPSLTACMAVGSATMTNGTVVTLAERYDGNSWTIVSSPNASGTGNRLFAVACPSATNCTAVGSTQGASAISTLAEHWNGSTWTIQTTTNPGPHFSALFGVACPNATNCFGVGGADSNTLVEHFDGTKWSTQSSPNPSGGGGSLEAVTCRSATKCFAAGSQLASAAFTTFAERWNGTNWALQTTPNPQTNNFLLAVVCPGGTSCFAVGKTFASPASLSQNFVTHFDGTTWSQQSISNPSRGVENDLDGVACLNTTDCTAVGVTDSGTQPRFLAEHWNGGAWTLEPGTSGVPGQTIRGVACVSTSFCMASGVQQIAIGRATLVLRWDGAHWTVSPTPNPTPSPSSVSDELNGIACVTTTSCTAVGTENTGTQLVTLVEHWNGGTWQTQSSPNLAGSTKDTLSAVTCATATDCMAVGNAFKPGTGTVTLAEHWNGTTWTVLTTPNTSAVPAESALEGVSCTASSRCTAVGQGEDSTGHVFTLAERWNRTAWTTQTSANAPSSTFDDLRSVVCTSAISCNATGAARISGASSNSPLAEQWNGTTWGVQAMQNPTGETNAQMVGLTCVTGQCFSVGSASLGTLDQTLVERLV